jgi:hypothetical protein
VPIGSVKVCSGTQTGLARFVQAFTDTSWKGGPEMLKLKRFESKKLPPVTL